MIQFPNAPTPNERLLGGWTIEEHTGLTGTTLTLERAPYDGLLLLAKNGGIVTPSTLTIVDATVTLGSAAVSGDVFVVWYLARSN